MTENRSPLLSHLFGACITNWNEKWKPANDTIFILSPLRESSNKLQFWGDLGPRIMGNLYENTDDYTEN